MNDSAPPPMAPAPGSSRNFERLKELLREMFQLDRGDLDFGLYRIMNVKAGEIEAFLECDLLPQVKEVLKAQISDEDREKIETRLDSTIKQLKALEAPVEENARVLQLRRHLAGAKADANNEADVYSHLANFFARYYNDGDFMSLRRYSGGGNPTYLIPYDGEEVKLHWANSDQHYVKTTENYASYAFMTGEGDAAVRVRFEVAAADNEKDNIKEANGKQRRFVLTADAQAVAVDDGDLVVRFEHRPLTENEKKEWPGNGVTQQGRINETTTTRILAAVETLIPKLRFPLATAAPTDADPERTLLAKHVERYTTKNSFDYFIHKDLGGFLRSELDLYIKTDVLNLTDLALGDEDRLRRALARMRAVRHVAEKIIDFLAQLEDFQKRLWLKKKFVLETQCCVTLDRIPEALYSKVAANEAQRQEWVALFAIDEIAGDSGNGDGYSHPLDIAFLKANPYLVLDTRYFDADFKNQVLAALSEAGPLDEQTDGLLIHSENFQALNLLQARYGEQVQCIYIDPPYNTENDGFIYKDRYKQSSWLTMMASRLEYSIRLLVSSGTFFSSIDHNQLSSFKQILDKILEENFEGVIAWRRRHNQPNDRTKMIGMVSEYLLAYAKDSMALRSRGVGKIDLTGIYSNPDDDPRGDWASKPWKVGSGQSGTHYSIKTPSGRLLTEEWMGGEDTYLELLKDNRIIFPSNGNGMPRKKYFKSEREEEGQCATNWWTHDQFGHNAGASKDLNDILGTKNAFNSPKPTELVRGVLQISGRSSPKVSLDFFAGSGTTGHAVINLNREDGGKRKYILVEMGDHFDTVMLPRLKKVAYAPDWKEGRPVSRDKGVSQLIKYVRLESYEDTLDGLIVTAPDDDLLADNDPALVEDYRLRYALGVETANSPCLLGDQFADPFAYTLSVVRDGTRREISADLPETFSYLLGLRVESRREFDGVLVIAGKDSQGRHCLILWRNLKTMDNSALNDWFAVNRAKFPDEFDLVYTNGDQTLNAMRQQGETWTAETIEPLFRQLMFEEDMQ